MDFTQHLRIALFDGNGLLPFDDGAVARLDEASAFVGRPAIRFIVVTAVRGGVFKRWAGFSGWGDDAMHELERFVAHTGFERLLVEGVLTAYADVLGWKPIDTNVYHCRSVYEPRAAYGTMADGCAAGAGALCADVLGAYNAVIVVDREKEAARGVTLESPCAVEADSHTVRITAVLRRLRPMGSASLRCSIMAAGGIVGHTAVVGVFTVVSPSVMPVSFDVPRWALVPKSINLCLC